MNHTPTPFQVRFNGIVAPAILFHQTPQGEQRIAEIYQGGDEGEANAAFIVRACNAHEALVDALEMAEGFRYSNADTWYPAVAAALKLAKGE